MGNAQGVDKKMLVAATTGSVEFAPRAGAHPQQGFYHHVSWATGVIAGTVVIETADVTAYAGTWAAIATVTNNGGGTAYEDYVYCPGQPKVMRHRVGTTVSGGGAPSVTTRLEGVPA